MCIQLAMGGHGGKEAGVIMMCWAGMLTRTFARHGKKLELDVSNALAWHKVAIRNEGRGCRGGNDSQGPRV